MKDGNDGGKRCLKNFIGREKKQLVAQIKPIFGDEPKRERRDRGKEENSAGKREERRDGRNSRLFLSSALLPKHSSIDPPLPIFHSFVNLVIFLGGNKLKEGKKSLMHSLNSLAEFSSDIFFLFFIVKVPQTSEENSA